MPARTRRSSRCRSPKLTAGYENVTESRICRRSRVEQVKHFFSHYKDLEPGKWVKIEGWHDSKYAKKMIVDAIARAKAGK